LPFTERVRDFRIRGLAQAALGTLDTLFKGESFRIIKLLLIRLGFAEKLEGSVILLIVKVVEPVTEQVAHTARGRHAVERYRCWRCSGISSCRQTN
jgi:hypothetical protein